MNLSELMTFLMIFTIVLTMVGASFFTMHAMELKTRTDSTPLELQTVIPQILEPFLNCTDLSRITFLPQEMALALHPCMNIVDIKKLSRYSFQVRLGQPQERQILIPFERSQKRYKQPMIQFSNGCTARLVRVASPTRLEIRVQDDCPPALGKAFPSRDDQAPLSARFYLSAQTLNLDFGFNVPNEPWHAIPGLKTIFPSVLEFNWTLRVLSHAYLLPNPPVTLLQYDLDRNNNRQLDLNESPIRRIYPAEFIDGMNLFLIIRGSRPSPGPVRCGSKLLQPGEFKKCVIVRIRQPV